MKQKEHWEKVYSTKPVERLGWYELHLQTSLNWIRELNMAGDAPIIDVGGGASTLVDDLLHEGFRCVTVMDLSAKALSLAKARLGERAKRVIWLEGDITRVDLPAHHYELWHDRAVFHFLTAPEQRERYRTSLLKALKPGGHLIMATFAPEAPPKCSGLPVRRYDVELLQNTLGAEFRPMRHQKELHVTPSGVEQMYLYCLFRRN